MKARIVAVVALIMSVNLAYSQFHSTGRGRTSTKWSQIDSTHYRIVYPSYYEHSAARISRLLDSIHPYINYSLDFPLRKVPIILHTENMFSNGYVTWAPRREELVMTPPISSYALTWSKQLAVHEWRHVAQISALRRGVTKVASWFLGEAGVAAGLFATPLWILEGDATLAETQFAEYGRGLQPDFTVGYRAMFADGFSDFDRLDRWINGSYKRFYPDIYKFGYQTLSAAETYLGKDYFGQMMAYSGRWPIFIIPSDIYLHNKHKTSFKKIAKRAFAELDSLWRPFADVEQNFEFLTLPNKRSYTTYGSPVEYDGGVVALKRDYDTPTRIVDVRSGRKVKSVGSLSSSLVVRGDRIYYTEYVPHPIFEQVSFSAIRELDTRSSRVRTYHKWARNYGLTEWRDGFAAISLDSLSRSFVRFFDSDFEVLGEHHFGDNRGEFSIHSLSWDSLTDKLSFIALDERGMYIGTLSGEGVVDELYSPNRITVANLSASDGVLYFNSIQSGKDEIHSIDITTKEQVRLSTSRFGSYFSSLSADSLLFTTYTSGGAMVASMAIGSEAVDSVSWSKLPINLLNAKRLDWGVKKVDAISIEAITSDTTSVQLLAKEQLAAKEQPTAKEQLTAKEQRKIERKKKFKAPFAVHSWAPVGVDGDYFMGDRPMNLTFGATAFFQSTLSKLVGYLSYGWLNNSNWLKGRVDYKGLPLTISAGAEYGGGRQSIYGAPSFTSPSVINTDLYFAGDVTLSLPLNLSIGGYSQLFQPSFKVQYTNALLYNSSTGGYDQGLAQYSGSLWWSSTRYTAHRDIVPRWGYAVRLTTHGAFRDDFSTQYSIFARGYLPGVAKNHSLTLRAAAQYQQINDYNISSKALYLKGVNDYSVTSDYMALMADYTLPIAYPDWGWDGVLYFNRIYANLFGGYSTGNYPQRLGGTNRLNNHTYGVDIGVDFSLIRSFPQEVTFTFAMPNDEFYFGISYSIGF